MTDTWFWVWIISTIIISAACGIFGGMFAWHWLNDDDAEQWRRYERNSK